MKMTGTFSILWSYLSELKADGIKRIWYSLDKMNTVPKGFSPSFNSESPITNDFITIALFGVDQRKCNPKFNGCNADCIILVSIEKKTKKLKALSVFRDTVLAVQDGVCCKANGTYSHLGPECEISMLNRNFDLRIRHFITADFKSFTMLADYVGGVEVPLSYNEIAGMNETYIRLSEEETGYNYSPIPLPDEPEDKDKPLGIYRLDGIQTTTYCRIRSTSNFDIDRTKRQRKVFSQILKKLQHLPSADLIQIAEKVLPLIRTSLRKRDVLRMVPTVLQCHMDASAGFPYSFRSSPVLHSCVVATEFTENVKRMHHFLYCRHDYKPSSEVEKNGQKIHEFVLKEESRLIQKKLAARKAQLRSSGTVITK